MKVKLLKKVRKNFTITLYPKNSVNPWDEKILEEDMYVVADKNDIWELWNYNNYEDAYERLLKVLRNKYKYYSKRFKSGLNKQTVIWYTKQETPKKLNQKLIDLKKN